MNLLFWDTETDGIPRWDLPADDPAQPHMVEMGAILCDDTGKELARYRSIVNPDGWTIPDYVSKIHGITTAIAMAEGKPIAEVLDGFDVLLAQAGLSVCFNVKFDDKILRGARRRIGRPDGFGSIPVFCCMRGATPVCKLPKKTKGGYGEFKQPKLTEAVTIILGREHIGAHGALADALATKDIYFACRDNHEFMAAGAAFKTNEARGAEAPAEKPPIPPDMLLRPPGKGADSTMDDLFNLYNDGDKAT